MQRTTLTLWRALKHLPFGQHREAFGRQSPRLGLVSYKSVHVQHSSTMTMIVPWWNLVLGCQGPISNLRSRQGLPGEKILTL